MNLLGGPKVGCKTLMMFLCFAPNFTLNVNFQTKLLLSHFPKIHVVYVSKLVHTTMLE
jgi:hypothetical protein